MKHTPGIYNFLKNILYLCNFDVKCLAANFLAIYVCTCMFVDIATNAGY